MKMRYFSFVLAFFCCAFQSEALKKTNNPGDHQSDKKNTNEEANKSPSAKPITFEEAVEAAFNNNPKWFGHQADRQIADEYYEQSKMAFLPNINANMSTTRSKRGNRQANLMATDTTIGIEASVNIFNGFATINTMKARSNSAQAAFYKLKFEEQKLIVEVAEAFAKVWVGRKNVDASKKTEENFKNTFESQKITQEAGMVATSEISSAETNYQNAIYERIDAETKLFAAESEFEKLTGLKADRELELPDLNSELPESLDDLITIAMTSNPSILHSKFSEQAANDKLNVERSKFSPVVDVTLKADRDLRKAERSAERSDGTHTVDGRSASLIVKVPIFNNSRSSEIEIANQELLKAKFATKDAILETKKECVVNWNTYISANAMIRSSRSAVKNAEISSASNQEESALGVKSNTEVWDKENKLLKSRVSLAESRARKVVSLIKLIALTGNLDLNSLLKKK